VNIARKTTTTTSPKVHPNRHSRRPAFGSLRALAAVSGEGYWAEPLRRLPPQCAFALFAGGDFECSVQADVGGGSPQHDFKGARFDDSFAVAVDEFQFRGGDLKTHGFAFAWREVDAIEPAEVHFVGRDAAGFLMEVQLRDFVPGPVSGVFDLTTYRHFAVCGYGGRGDFEAAVLNAPASRLKNS